MKHFTTLLLIISCSCTAFATNGINFEKKLTWNEIKAKAKKEKKMIFFDAYTSWCGPCQYLETSIYTNRGVASYYNSNFINAKFDMEKGEGINLAKEFNIMAYPTLLFFSSEGKLLHKNVGAMEAPAFINLGKDALNPSKQFYTLQQKVVDKQVSKELFLTWLKMAEEIDEIRRADIAAGWLSVQPDLLATAELAKATMQYANVNEKQLSYLYKEKKKIQLLLKWSTDEINTSIYEKLFILAAKSFDKGNPFTTGFSNTINKFEPARLSYALKELQFFTALKSDNDQEKAMNLLITGMKENQRATLKESAILLFNYVAEFDQLALTKLQSSLSAYRFTATDKGNECWLYLMQIVTGLQLQDYTNLQELASKAYKHGGLTKLYKDFVRGIF